MKIRVPHLPCNAFSEGAEGDLISGTCFHFSASDFFNSLLGLYAPGRYHVLAPTLEKWNQTNPEWAKNRRDEICGRGLSDWPKDWVELPDDWPAAPQ